MYQMSREEKASFVREEILTTAEACQLLGRTRQQLNNYIRKGEIKAIIVTTNGNLFLKDDVLSLKHYITSSASYNAGFEDAQKKYNISPFSKPVELKDFVNEMTAGKMEKGNYSFVLMKYSKQEPYWCVFACRLDNENKQIVAIGGHYCLGKDVNLHEVLDSLCASGWNVKVQTNLFLDWED